MTGMQMEQKPKKQITEAQRKARQENARKLNKLPKTEKQIEHARRLAKEHPGNHRSAKQLAALAISRKKAALKPINDKQRLALANGRWMGTLACKAKQAWRKGLEKVHTPEGREQARQWAVHLRKTGLKETGIERRIKSFLQVACINFEQEYTFDGIGTVDFYLPQFGAVIECDGEYWHNQPGAREKDAQRDASLNSIGIQVLRFTGREINKQMPQVQQRILNLYVGSSASSNSPD